MTLLLKDPDAILDYAIDWGAEYLDNEMLAESDWAVGPVEAGGLAIVGSDFGPAISSVKASGGVPGHVYRLTNRVTLQSGREDKRSIMLRVEKR